MNVPATVSVQAIRQFDAAAETLFDAWLDPQIARRFLFATPHGQMVRAEIDARVGGRFVFVDRRDGQDIEHTGEYLEIGRPRRLVFTFCVPQFSAASTRVQIEIVPQQSGCELTLTHDGVLPDYAERTQAGWSGILERLAASLAG